MAHRRGRRPSWGRGVLLLLTDWVTLLALLAGCLYAALTSYGIRRPDGFPAVLGLLALLSALLWRLPGWWAYGAGGGLLAALTLTAAVNRETLGPAARLLWGDVCAALERRWSFMDAPVVTAGRGEILEMLPWLLVLLAAALALLLGWAAVRVRQWQMALGLALLPVVPAITAGILPAWSALMGILTAVLTLLFTDLYSRRDPAALGRAALLSLAGTGVLLLGLTAAVPKEHFVRPQWAKDLRQQLMTLGGERISSLLEQELPLGGGTAGEDPAVLPVPGETAVLTDPLLGTGTVDLTKAGPRFPTGEAVLWITGEEAGRVYLRGSSAAAYTGQSWEPPERKACQALETALEVLAPGEEALIPRLPAQTDPEGAERTLTVEPVVSHAVYYAPYQVAGPLPDGGRWALDSSVNRMPGGADSAQWTYRPAAPEERFVPLAGEAAQAEERYRSFARDTYLEVPSRTAQVLAPLQEEMDSLERTPDAALPEALAGPLDAARRAAAVLSRRAVYDLETPAMSQGDDFVEHFLTQGRGYCMHFATAGAMLLRMEGIPARYVSGYVAYLDRGGHGVARDSGAHAWVEVYLEGYGWYPVEMTPAYLGEDMEIPREEPLPEPEEPPVPPEEPEKPEELEKPEEPEEPQAPERQPVDLRWLLWPVGIALTAAAAVLPRFAARAYRRWQEGRKERRRSVVAAYRYCRRLTKWSGREEETVRELAEKAVFSQHGVTAEEQCAAWSAARAAAGRTAGGLPGWKRLAFQWLWLLD